MSDGARRAHAFLVDRGAGELAHPGGTLLDHLGRTHRTLVGWEVPAPLASAGLCHALYGTDGFPHRLVDPADRHVVVALVGTEAEAIIHRYACCDRAAVTPQLGLGPTIAFRDRSTGAITDLGSADLRAFAELTVANELDVLRHAPLTGAERADLADLLTRCRPLVRPAAVASIDAALGQRGRRTGAARQAPTDLGGTGPAGASRRVRRRRPEGPSPRRPG